ncbi:DUF2569 domain-containing protein [Aliidiomarina sp.]|uniref:DUF2569 domain-containing protein n=1 Tax=Aliidiomarina sp. TaxID=1872439 RepID=UPI003A4DF39C
MGNEKNLQGLRGWLILVAIGVIIAPIRLLSVELPMYTEILNDGTWELLTSADSELYHPLWAPVLITEITFSFVLLLASLYLVVLFFSKHYLFPRVFIAITLAMLIFIPFDSWLVSQVLPEESFIDTQTIRDFSRTVVSAAIWIPYMLVSKRVKATFVEKKLG